MHAARLPVGFALTGAKADEGHSLLGIFDADPELPISRVAQIVIADKNYFDREFGTELDQAGNRRRRRHPDEHRCRRCTRQRLATA